MKKYLSIIVVVACIATICILPTNTVPNSKILADDPPVLIPPLKAPGTKPTPVIINIRTLPRPTTRLA